MLGSYSQRSGSWFPPAVWDVVLEVVHVMNEFGYLVIGGVAMGWLAGVVTRWGEGRASGTHAFVSPLKVALTLFLHPDLSGQGGTLGGAFGKVRGEGQGWDGSGSARSSGA